MSHRPRVLTRPARLAGTTVLVLAAMTMSTGAPAGAVSDRAHRPALSFAGESTLAAGLPFEGTVVGGLSSLTYDESRDVYYALSDAQPNLGQGPFRFYTLRGHVRRRLDPGDVTVVGVTLLTDASGLPVPGGGRPRGPHPHRAGHSDHHLRGLRDRDRGGEAVRQRVQPRGSTAT